MKIHDKSRLIAEKIEQAGGRAYIVGGYIRDAIIGGPEAKDLDLEVYGLEPDALEKVLSASGVTVDTVGASFQVFKLSWNDGEVRHEIDISIPRIDVKNGEGHKGFEVTGNPYATFEEAASRRDFTMNTILEDAITGERVDPFGGQQSIKDKVIKAVDASHFGEDSLRVLRAAQFAGRLNFQIDPVTADLCRATPVNDLPNERIWVEIEKMLLKSSNIKTGFDALYDLNIINRLFPELTFSRQVIPYDAMNAINKEGLTNERKIICHLALLISIISEQDRESLLDKLGAISAGKPVVEKAIAIAKNINVPVQYFEVNASDYEYRKLAFKVDPILLSYVIANKKSKVIANWFSNKMSSLGVLDGPQAPVLQGRHLIEAGMKPNPVFGKILDAAYEEQMKGNIKDLEQAKVWFENGGREIQ